MFQLIINVRLEFFKNREHNKLLFTKDTPTAQGRKKFESKRMAQGIADTQYQEKADETLLTQTN